MPEDHLLVRAARGEVVERPPVWAMRQAGRWDPEFNRVRAGLSFYEFSENVEKAAQASLCPRRFGVDGIILFYDITTLPVAMGLPFQLKPQQGPVPDRPVRSQADVDRLDPSPDPSRYDYIVQLLRTVRRELNGALPVLAFAGAPFTVAAYCIGTGKHMDQTRRFAAENPIVWRSLLDRLAGATIGFLNELAKEGAAVYQLFDSWAGELRPAEYAEWAQPYHAQIFAGAASVPRILFVKECPYLDEMTKTGADVISLGSRHDFAEARRRYPHLVFQGNVDSDVLKSGTPEQVRSAVQKCLEAGGGQRHIVNLNHGVDKATPVENFEAYVQAALSRKRHFELVSPCKRMYHIGYYKIISEEPMRRRHFFFAVPLAIAGVSLLLTGCPANKTPDPWANAGNKPKVLVSFAPLHSFAASVAGPDAEVKCLLTTSGPHTHGDVTAQQIELARGCDVFFINGLGLDDEADGIAKRIERVAANPKWNVVNLGAKLDEGWLCEGECHHDHSKGEEHHEHGTDPHVWLSIRCAKTMVEGIRDELKRIDPAHADGYEQRASDYLKKLDALEADGKAMLAPKTEKWIVPFHDSLAYFGQTYGLKIATSIQVDPGKEPTSEKLSKVIQTCRKRNARVIAVEPQFSNHTSARVIRDALRGLKDDPIDAVFVEIDPLETCDERDLGPDLYEKTMRRNLVELAKALR